MFVCLKGKLPRPELWFWNPGRKVINKPRPILVKRWFFLARLRDCYPNTCGSNCHLEFQLLLFSLKKGSRNQKLHTKWNWLSYQMIYHKVRKIFLIKSTKTRQINLNALYRFSDKIYRIFNCYLKSSISHLCYYI